MGSIERFAYASRGHWGVENKLHWSLDVIFHEDDSRIRKGHAPENMTVIRKIALTYSSKNPLKGPKKPNGSRLAGTTPSLFASSRLSMRLPFGLSVPPDSLKHRRKTTFCSLGPLP